MSAVNKQDFIRLELPCMKFQVPTFMSGLV